MIDLIIKVVEKISPKRVDIKIIARGEKSQTGSEVLLDVKKENIIKAHQIKYIPNDDDDILCVFKIFNFFFSINSFHVQ